MRLLVRSDPTFSRIPFALCRGPLEASWRGLGPSGIRNDFVWHSDFIDTYERVLVGARPAPSKPLARACRRTALELECGASHGLATQTFCASKYGEVFESSRSTASGATHLPLWRRQRCLSATRASTGTGRRDSRWPPGRTSGRKAGHGTSVLDAFARRRESGFPRRRSRSFRRRARAQEARERQAHARVTFRRIRARPDWPLHVRSRARTPSFTGAPARDVRHRRGRGDRVVGCRSSCLTRVAQPSSQSPASQETYKAGDDEPVAPPPSSASSRGTEARFAMQPRRPRGRSSRRASTSSASSPPTERC